MSAYSIETPSEIQGFCVRYIDMLASIVNETVAGNQRKSSKKRRNGVKINYINMY